jgi:hypothetical protein
LSALDDPTLVMHRDDPQRSLTASTHSLWMMRQAPAQENLSQANLGAITNDVAKLFVDAHDLHGKDDHAGTAVRQRLESQWSLVSC